MMLEKAADNDPAIGEAINAVTQTIGSLSG